MHSILWDNFCENQNLTEFEEVSDLSSSGVLASLIKHNSAREVSYDCIHYPGGTTDKHGAFTDYTTYHVDAFPAQSEMITFCNGEKINYLGPEVRNNQIIHRAAPPSSTGWPRILLDYKGYPEFWGDTLKKPPRLHYPRSITLARKPFDFEHYIRVVSYSDTEMSEHQMWKEAVIDTEFSMAVLLARHWGSNIDDVWISLHVEERSDWRAPESKTIDYCWDF